MPDRRAATTVQAVDRRPADDLLALSASVDAARYLATIVESCNDAIISKSLDGIIFSWNAAAERLYGYRRDEAIGRSIELIVPVERRGELQQIMERLAAGERLSNFETVRQCKDGRRVDVTLSISPIRDEHDEIVGVSAIARDLSGPKSAIEAEREGFARLRAVVETAVDGIITIDERGTIETVNPAAVRMFGYDTDELIGQNVSVLMPAPYQAEHDGYLTNFLNTGVRKIIGIGREVSGRRKDGTIFPMELAVSETRLRSRRIFTGIVRDISRRHEAERALRESEARFRLLANNAPVMIWMCDVDQAGTWFSRHWLEFTGRSIEQELGDGWKLSVHPDDLERCVNTYRAAFDGRQPFEIEFRLRRCDGEYRWVVDVGHPMQQDGGDFVGYIGSCIDVTDRKLDEAMLVDRVNQRTHELSAANEQLHYQIEEKRRIESLLATENRILELIATGADLEQLLGALCEAIESLVPDSRCAIRLGASNGNVEATASMEQNGAVTIGLDVFGSLTEEGVCPPVVAQRTIVPRVAGDSDDEPYAHGVRTYWYEPIIAPRGAVLGTLGVYSLEEVRPDEDALSATAMAARLAGIVVERARGEAREREQLAQLAHVARLATMGEMASGLAHELNQPLCAITNFTGACVELLKNGNSDPEQLSQTLGEVGKQAERAGAVIRRLRDFVRRREPAREPVDINAVVREVVAFTNVEARHQEIRIRMKLAKRLPSVYADSIQIEQVLVNLVRNACDAMREGGRGSKVLTIETVRRKGAVEVRVHDCGPGIPDEIKERLFEPFFTTKRDGMGMGLSITRSILEVHDGCLWVTSNRSGGTTFHFTLPTAWRARHGRRHGLRGG